MPRTAALLATLLVAVPLAACGGQADESAGAGGPSTEGAPARSDGAGPADADAVPIAMKGIRFVPARASARVGQRVVWTNEEDVPHDVVSSGEGPLDSGLVGPGDTYGFTPEEPGTLRYRCTIHPGMDGILTVRE